MCQVHNEHYTSDVQAQRKECTSCTGCPGFEIWFRPCDANDPEVMLHCSACGCPAHLHAVDKVRCSAADLNASSTPEHCTPCTLCYAHAGTLHPTAP